MLNVVMFFTSGCKLSKIAPSQQPRKKAPSKTRSKIAPGTIFLNQQNHPNKIVQFFDQKQEEIYDQKIRFCPSILLLHAEIVKSLEYLFPHNLSLGISFFE